VALACSASLSARADPANDAVARAKAADASARVHYNLREYAAAIADYRRAFEALPDPLFLFNIAQAYRQFRDCENARVMYRNYLRERPAADNRAKVEQFIVEMDACAAQATQPTPVPAQASQHRGVRIAGTAAGAAGLAAIGTGVYFSVVGAQRAQALETACSSGCDGSNVASIDRDGHDANRGAIVAYAIGGAALSAGVALWIWAWLDRRDERVTVNATPSGASVLFRF
jgi:tetratricopeptide (TPR) repeat protein